MNKKLKPKTKEDNEDEEENLIQPKESKQSSIRIDLHWRILYFIPTLLLGIAFQYGIQYQMVNDIVLLNAYSNNDFNGFAKGLMIITISAQKLVYIYYLL